jgi:hypothetical protein
MQRKTTTTTTRRIHHLIEDEEDTGFSAGFISGYALSASLLGKPEFGLLRYVGHHSSLHSFDESLHLFKIFNIAWIGFCRPPEMAATARTVCAAPLKPIIADAGKVFLFLRKTFFFNLGVIFFFKM